MSTLPEGWTAHQDAEGRTFYANAATGESSWEAPAATYAAPAAQPPPYPGSDALPEGWSAHQDDQGRTFYHNAASGETSWDKPAGAPVTAAPAGQWTTDACVRVGGEGCEHLFASKVCLLDKGTYSSVMSTVAALNEGTVAGVESGFCVIYSRSKASYFLMWRTDKAYEATTLGIDPEDSWWSADFARELGPPGYEHVFEGKAQLLDTAQWNSVSSTCEALNTPTLEVPAGFCVMFSQSQKQYYLLWRWGKELAANAALGLDPRQ